MSTLTDVMVWPAGAGIKQVGLCFDDEPDPAAVFDLPTDQAFAIRDAVRREEPKPDPDEVLSDLERGYQQAIDVLRAEAESTSSLTAQVALRDAAALLEARRGDQEPPAEVLEDNRG